ncbi:MAG: acetyl-CoA carboxylase carboxyltransferase subunit alpha [Alphaproteobacteria bacterium]|nr:acetyl-CoA carboxylase carboxyltransferase subunit alpha [Alphaproteobacteria bacterium]MDE2336727.1 acetyl-CoA carboxylase carboxyltransferase subunit alpha [Alphaproteobacteria bacterium]
MAYHLEFEKKIVELESKVLELQSIDKGGVDLDEEISRIREKAERILTQTYAKLAPEEKVQVARHPDRPHFGDYARRLIQDFTPLAGDRGFGEDAALIGGLGRFRGQSCVVMGQEKGHDTPARIKHNFGMPRPEGYRKAQRLMAMAHQFSLPIITLVDTAGAYPGIGAEERGQSEAIAKSIESCLRAETPLVSVIIGEGGSGGAIAIAAADRVFMLEHSIYSVISPEGCASILWRSATYANEAARALKLTAQDLKQLGIIDGIIPEPVGGAHREPEIAIDSVGDAIEKALSELTTLEGPVLKTRRRQKFLEMGHAI